VLITEAYPTLAGNQRKVGDFLLSHRQEVPFLSIAEIERRTGTSKATVVRFSRKLGFSGFFELRSKLLAGVRSQYRLPDLFQVPPTPNDDETLIAIAHQDVKNINQTISHLDRETFDHIVQRVTRAPRVYAFGLGISALLSQILAYSLNQVGVKAAAFIHGQETAIEQLPFVTSSDLVFVFSFPPYSRETVEMAKAAASRRIAVVGITDKVTSPVSYHCTYVLPIRSQNKLFTNSISAISVVINALTTEVALRNRTRALRFIKNTERLLQLSGHYTTA
jgi:DNA-binding MurR/RpiR family transcriptional regulator